MNKSNLIHIISSTTLVLALGMIIGYSAGYFQTKRSSFTEFQQIRDINPGVATIQLMQVEDGNLTGKVEGQNARIIYNSNDILELNKGEEFEIALSNINLNHFFVSEELPEGTQFIASKSGKYYYSILDKKAFNLSPNNRIYFTSSQEAETAGYLPK